MTRARWLTGALIGAASLIVAGQAFVSYVGERSIVGAVAVLVLMGVTAIGFASLARARRYIARELAALAAEPPAGALLQARRAQLAGLRARGVSPDLDLLGDATAAAEAERGYTGRYLVATTVLIGLVGTFGGLMETLARATPLLKGDLSSGAGAPAGALALLAGPLAGLHVTFGTSVVAILVTLALTLVQGDVTLHHERLLALLQERTRHILVPELWPAEDSAAERTVRALVDFRAFVGESLATSAAASAEKIAGVVRVEVQRLIAQSRTDMQAATAAQAAALERVGVVLTDGFHGTSEGLARELRQTAVASRDAMTAAAAASREAAAEAAAALQQSGAAAATALGQAAETAATASRQAAEAAAAASREAAASAATAARETLVEAATTARDAITAAATASRDTVTAAATASHETLARAATTAGDAITAATAASHETLAQAAATAREAITAATVASREAAAHAATASHEALDEAVAATRAALEETLVACRDVMTAAATASREATAETAAVSRETVALAAAASRDAFATASTALREETATAIATLTSTTAQALESATASTGAAVAALGELRGSLGAQLEGASQALAASAAELGGAVGALSPTLAELGPQLAGLTAEIALLAARTENPEQPNAVLDELVRLSEDMERLLAASQTAGSPPEVAVRETGS